MRLVRGIEVFGGFPESQSIKHHEPAEAANGLDLIL
jgi:hypothetical protein